MTHRTAILLADDDYEMRRLVAEVLRRAGLSVTVVRTGAELLGEIGRRMMPGQEGQAPELVVTDVRMPGPNPVYAVAALRRGGWRTPVVFITAFGDSELHARVAGIADAAILDKPLDPWELRSEIVRLLAAARERAQVAS